MLLNLSCAEQSTQKYSFKKFNTIKLEKFNKKKVSFSTTFNFLNESEQELKIIKSDFDIFVNGKDISSHINNTPIIVNAKKNYEIPIQVTFLPSKVFTDYKSGLVKIKSDIIATVEITGIIAVEIDGKLKEISYSDEQLVLFTNNNKIKLNNKGEIIQRN